MSLTSEKAEYISRVKEARKRSGLTQEAVANHLGVDRVTYTNYEVMRGIPQKYIAKFCDLVGVSVEWLVYGNEAYSNKGDNWELKQLEFLRQLKDADRQRFEDAMKVIFPDSNSKK